VGDLLDVVLVLSMVGFAVSGYRQGFVVGAISFLGFLGGGILGATFAPNIVRAFAHGDSRPLLAIVVVFAAAVAGQLLVTPVGLALRRLVRWRPAEVLDSTAGAAVSVIGVLLVAWLVGTAIAHSPYRALARQVQHSRIETAVNSVMPQSASTWFAQFQRVFDRSGFPQVFGGLGDEAIRNVRAPDTGLVGSPAAAVARKAVVEVIGDAPSCGRRVQGTGFVYAPRHVLTNAHVVAGVDNPTVTYAHDARTYVARVVLYDPNRDVAVLYVPDLDPGAPELEFAPTALASGDDAVVIGFPQGGPFDVEPARVRGKETVRGPNIYQSRTVTREIYAVRSRVRPGNSGGPLLTPTGRVEGVVFAASYDDPQTGYALTNATVRPEARAAAQATRSTSTHGCTSD
jgi:S1-C subfamily serine protease